MISRIAFGGCRKVETNAVLAALRQFSSSNGGGKGKPGFRPRRQPSRGYRPIDAKAKKLKGKRQPNDFGKTMPVVDLSNLKITDADPSVDEAELDAVFGSTVANTIRSSRKQARDGPIDTDTYLKMVDYMTSKKGSTEDLVGERRALSLGLWDHEDRDEFMQELDDFVEEQRIKYLGLDGSDDKPLESDVSAIDQSGQSVVPPNRLAHGDWGELVVRTDRVRKMWRGGRIESYRSLVIGGNLNGCGGFGIGKSFEPEDAVEIACRMARRNIFFVDRYRNRGLTRDLVGRQNSCRVHLRCTSNGMRGNPLACEILKLMGITNVVAKAHGNRNHFNVVRATFKALMTHESLEDISMKRGIRLVNLQKASRLGLN